MNKKFFLEELFEELRSLSEQYEMDENEVDIFLLKPNEINAFSEDVLKITKKYLEKDLSPEEEDEDDLLEIDGYEDVFWPDDDEVE